MKTLAHSKTYAAKMEKISKQIKYLPISHSLKIELKKYLGRREYKKLYNAEKAKGSPKSFLDTIANHWHYESTLIYEERRQLITDKYIRKANSLFVPVPQFTFGIDDNECWKTGTNGYFWYLTDKGLAIVREEIEKEEKRRREARAHWVRWVSALTG